MTKIVLSHEDYERVLREGIDLDAYLQGRFDEAASAVKYLNDEIDITVPLSIDGEALAKTGELSDAENAKNHALHAQMTADRAIERIDELMKRISYQLPDGTSVMIGDVFEFPVDRVAKVIKIDNGICDLPIEILWIDDERTEWMTESEMMDGKKLPV